MKTRDQLQTEFCKIVSVEGLQKLLIEALDNMQFLESQVAIYKGRTAKAEAQIARQAQIITGLEQALK